MTLSVVVASLPNRNLGMQSVNAAARQWVHSMDSEGVRGQLFQFATRHTGPVVDRAAVPSELLGHLDEAVKADLIVYWGDFLHMQHYAVDLAHALTFLSRGQRPELAGDPLTTVYDHLLLRSSSPEVLSRAVLVGGTLALNSPLDYHKEVYRASLYRLVATARRVLMRDPYSASLSSLLRPSEVETSLGCDCALLLDPSRVRGFSATQPSASDGQALVFLGRNVQIGESTRFARQLCKVLGVSPVWIKWLDDHLPSARTDIVGRLLKPRHRLAVPIPSEMPDDEALGCALSAIARSRCVITDTYHLAINAWSLGIPAVCISDTAEDLTLSYNSGRRHAWRDKRYEFFSLAEALPFFVRTEELRSRRRTASRIVQLRTALSGEDGSREVALERIALLRTRLRENLGRACRSAGLSEGGRVGHPGTT